MKTLYLDCSMGAAGDMLTAALLELLPDPVGFVDRLNALGLPGVRYRAEAMEKCGIRCTHIAVTVDGVEEESLDAEHTHHDHGHEHDHHHEHEHDHHHDHDDHDHGHENDHDHHHEHEHDHGHHHAHHGMTDIRHIICDHLDLPEAVREDVLAVYGLIAEAESHAHGRPVEEIHFHEVGTMDAVADVTAVCLLLRELAPDKVVASPVHVGSGSVRCAHGILPVPAPATAWLLRGIPSYGGDVVGELCTPTGAALLRRFVREFGPQPAMRTERIGYGCGKKDFDRANCVRAMLGETADRREEVAELRCNLDDMTPEALGFAMEQLYDAGALEVFTTPAGMKKNRPGVLLTCLCRPEQREAMVRLLFRHTTTLGIRESVCPRYTLERGEQTVETARGPVRVKIARGWGVVREKPEYEDLARIARAEGLSLPEAAALLRAPREGN